MEKNVCFVNIKTTKERRYLTHEKKIAFVSVFFFAISFFVSAKADTYNFSVWYSNRSEIGAFNHAIKVYPQVLSGAGDLMHFVGYGCYQWSMNQISCSIITSPTTADVIYYSGSVSQMNARGFLYASDTVGQSYWAEMTLMSDINDYKYLFKLKKTYASVVRDRIVEEIIAGMENHGDYSGVIDANTYELLYRNVALHELSHAIGWWDHSSNNQDVMYGTCGSERNALTSRDINHLRQAYTYLNP